MPGKVTSYDQALLQIGIQSARGTPAVLTASSVLLVGSLEASIKQMDEEQMDLASDDPFYKPTSRSNFRTSFKFDVPWIYSGTAGTASPLEPVFLCCGFDSTKTAGSKVVYTRASLSGVDLATMVMQGDIDGATADEYKTTDAIGEIGCTWEAGKKPRFNVSNLTGNYILPANAALVVPNWGVQKTNLGEEWEGTVAYMGKFVVGGVDKALCLTSMSCDNLSGMTVKRTPFAGCTGGTVPSNVQPKFTVTYRKPDYALEFNPWSLDKVGVEFGCGSVAGRKIRISCPSLEVVGETKRTKGPDGNTFITQTLQALTAITITEE
jgi:hypothetical protein